MTTTSSQIIFVIFLEYENFDTIFEETSTSSCCGEAFQTRYIPDYLRRSGIDVNILFILIKHIGYIYKYILYIKTCLYNREQTSKLMSYSLSTQPLRPGSLECSISVYSEQNDRCKKLGVNGVSFSFIDTDLETHVKTNLVIVRFILISLLTFVAFVAIKMFGD